MSPIPRATAMTLAAKVALAAAAAAPAGATTVELRVEAAGAPAPLFSGPVSTGPHAVDGGDGSGGHTCDGPAGATPGATATGALDDAMRAAGLTWRGNWDPSFRDFFIERIGSYASHAPDEYWSLTIDGHYAPGGCQATLAEGDEVRFFYGPAFGGQPGVAGGGPGSGAPVGGEPTSPVGALQPTLPGTSAGVPTAAPTHPGRLAARAARYLRRHREAAGDGWAHLALAFRSGGDAIPKAAAALLRGRLGPDAPRTGAVRTASVRTALRSGSIQTSAALREALRPGPAQTSSSSVPHEEPRAGSVRTSSVPYEAPRRGPIQTSSALRGALRSDGLLNRDIDATAIAVLALDRSAPGSARRAAAWLSRVQGTSGGFGFRPGVPPDVDSTGLAAWALAREGRTAAARRAAIFVASAQESGGGFPPVPGGEPNAQSSGLALVALRVGSSGGSPPPSVEADALGYLAGLARPDGSIPYAADSDPTPVWSTAQALLGLLPRSKLLRR